MAQKETYGRDKLTTDQMEPTAEKALAKGHSHYFDGTTCSRGHVSPKHAKYRYCAICTRNRNNKRYHLNRDKRLAESKNYAKNNPEKVAAYKKKYYKKNKDKLLAQHKVYNAKNREKNAERERAYCEENREKIRKQKRAYYLKNRKEILRKKRQKTKSKETL